jgi:DNA-binding transcriptional LysR family regulator
MSTLNPRQLEAFRMVMLRGSVTAAAQFLGKSQPAVSRLIRDLERALGLPLFQRHGNHLIPTPEAQLFLFEAERHFVGLQSLATYAADLAASKRGTLEVVALPAMAMNYLPPLMARFLTDRALSRVYLHGMPSHLVIEAITSGKADIGIAAAPAERPGLVIDPLQAHAVVVMPKNHRLARRRNVKLSDIKDEQLIALSEATAFAGPLPEALSAALRTATAVTPLSGIACQFVAAGGGIALVDPFVVAGLADRRLVAIPFEPPIDIRFAIVTSAMRPVSSVAREFIVLLKREVLAVVGKRRVGDA